ncbi:hypothetical protein LCGC14_0960760 [marine sediment metagenome]|uniref:Uncharacterized protein n=1 Tax=marine sediment metagenome TaxID=412755 RepID=A0A0F9NEH9_9ZZZZ
MHFKLKFDTDNDAFATDWQNEVTAILQDVAEAIEGGCLSSSIHDSNGNTVGRFFATLETPYAVQFRPADPR